MDDTIPGPDGRNDDSKGPASFLGKISDLPGLLAGTVIPAAAIERNLKVHYGNTSFKELLGLGDSALPHTPYFISHQYEQEFRQAVEDAFNGKARHVHEIGLRAAAGDIVYVDASLLPANGPAHNLVLAIFNDITRIISDRERQGNLNQLVVIGELVSLIAHELNNPLAAIVGFSQLLKSEALPPDAVDSLDQISASAALCRRIADKLLSYARRQPLNRTDVRVNCLIAGVLRSFTHELQTANITTRLSADPNLPAVRADVRRLETVIANLIYNACQAMPDGGTLTIETRTAPGNVESRMTGAPPAQSSGAQRCVEIHITDTGPGIPSSALPVIFEPFFTTRGRESTGIGLSISSNIIKKHDGGIRVGHASSAGTTFVVVLPAAPSGDPKQESQPADRSRTKRVLVIDDELACCKVLSMALTREGHQVDTAHDGEEAIRKLETQCYDVLIADVKMPRLDGPHLYELIRSKDPDLASRIVFVTGDSMGLATHNFLYSIPNPHLMKPFDVNKVNRLVCEM